MKYLYLDAKDKLHASEHKMEMQEHMHLIGKAGTSGDAQLLCAKSPLVQTKCSPSALAEFIFQTFGREEKHYFLSQYRYCTRELDRLAEEHKKTKDRLAYQQEGLVDMFFHPKNPAVSVDITNLAAIRTQIGRGTVKIEKLRQAILDAVNSLQDPVLRQLLAYKYLNGLTCEQMAEQMHYDPRHIKRLQKKALMQLSLPTSCRCMSPGGDVKMQAGLRTGAPSALSL